MFDFSHTQQNHTTVCSQSTTSHWADFLRIFRTHYQPKKRFCGIRCCVDCVLLIKFTKITVGLWVLTQKYLPQLWRASDHFGSFFDPKTEYFAFSLQNFVCWDQHVLVCHTLKSMDFCWFWESIITKFYNSNHLDIFSATTFITPLAL